MDQRSVFFEEWIRSLREQYKHVVRGNDRVTLPTLTAVLQNVGFSEDELAQLRVEATMHVDDVPADFAPDMNVLKGSATVQAHPAECACPQCVAIDESQFDAEGQPLAPDADRMTHETGHIYAAAKIGDEALAEDTLPLTFEDSLIATVDEVDEEPAESEDISEAADEETDPDGPQQMSLF